MDHSQQLDNNHSINDAITDTFIFPVSFAQQRLWLLDRLLGVSNLYNTTWAIQLTGKLDVPALQKSLDTIVARHEVLRTGFIEQDQEIVQVINKSIAFSCALMDLSNIPQQNREDDVQRILIDEASQAFDLKQPPLLRALLLCLSEQEYILQITIHHIVVDGWSMIIFQQELASCYSSFSQNRPVILPDLPIQYADYAVWQRDWLQGEVLEKQLDYWRKHLTNPTTLFLPTDRSRPKQQSYKGAQVPLQLSAALTKKLKALSNRQGVTLFMTLQAAFQVLLHRYSGQDDIFVGTAIAGRKRKETTNLIGFFVNTLILRTDLSGNPSFAQLLNRVRDVCLGAYAHQDLPFEKLVAELHIHQDRSRHPLFQVMLILQPSELKTMQLPELTIHKLTVPNDTAKFDVLFSLKEDCNQLTGTIEYSTDLFNADTMTRMADHFQTLLAAVVEHTDATIAELPLLTESERQQLLIGWNSTKTDYPKYKCIHQLFATQAAKTPDAVAIIFEDQRVSYRALNAKANQLAYRLKTLGVETGALIAICMERSIDLVASLLAVLKAGGAYLPLDPTYPRQRLAFMLEDSKASFLLTHRKLDLITDTLVTNNSVQRIHADSESAASDSDYLETNINSENLAYVIYTSGSTGKPKGVQINHRSVINFLMSMIQLTEITEQDVLLAVTTPSFDIAGLEIYLPLISGASIILASSSLTIDGFGLAKALNASNAVTIMQATPATWRLVLEAGWSGNPNLKILCGGEALSHELALQLQKKSRKTWNLYGPTETTIWSTASLLPDKISDNKIIAIGKPIANTHIYILDAHLQPVPVGIAGELYIGGDGLAKGYLNNPELTAKKFINHPFIKDTQARLYKTGDLARYRSDGSIEYLGRIDQQIKLNGFRIEPAEIETVLREYPGINEAIVIVRKDQLNTKRLVGYVVSAISDKAPDTPVLRKFLSKKLPGYMVPAAFVTLKTMPLMLNGKIDRCALPHPEITAQSSEDSFSPLQGKLEEQLAKIWKQVLQTSAIGRDDNFFDLGGSSFLFFRLTVLVEKRFSISFSENSLLQAHTIKEQAIHIESVKKLFEPPQRRQLNISDSDFKRLLVYVSGRKEKTHPNHPLIFPYNQHLSGIPLYFINGGRYLAAHIKNRPFYDFISGFNVIKLDKENMNALADYYTDEIIKLNPTGPYLLGGYCSGGLLAFEIAKRLLAQEKSVPLLMMVDQILPYTYTGDIAFFPFVSNKHVNNLFDHDNSDILKRLYPGNWTIDTIESEHYPELYYMTSIVLSERIEARIHQILENKNIKPLPDSAKQCTIKVALQEQSFQQIIFTITITNRSQQLWPMGQICIAHHWLSNLDRVILYAENKVTINHAIAPGQDYEFSYHVDKLKESGDAKLVFSILDKYGNWFEMGLTIPLTRTIHTYDSPCPDLTRINQLEEQGYLTQAIQYYYHYLHDNNSSKVLIMLASAVRHARGAPNAIDIYTQALTNCSTSEKGIIHRELAEGYIALENYDKAVFHAKQSLKINNNDHISLSYIALAHAHNKNYSRASNIFKLIINKTKGHYPEKIIYNLNKFIEMVPGNKDNHKYINSYLKLLIKTNPYNVTYHFNHARNLFAIGQQAKAERVILDSIDIYPYITIGHEVLFSMYMHQEEFDKAIAMQYKICELKPFCIDQRKQLLQAIDQGRIKSTPAKYV